MPYRRRRRWRKFVKKVEAVAEAKRGTQSVVFNTRKREQVPENLQRMYGLTLYGYNGSVAAEEWFNNDMAQIAAMGKLGDTNVTYNRKIHFRSAVMDVTIRNIGINAVELDIYEWFPKKDIKFARLIDMIVDGSLDPNTTTGGNRITHDDVGVTPFQFPSAMQYVTITNKTKVFLSPVDGVSTFQMRLPANRWWYTGSLNEDTTTFAKRSWTKGLWIVQKGVPGVEVLVPANTARSLLSDVVWSITRTYTLKTMDDEEENIVNYVPQ